MTYCESETFKNVAILSRHAFFGALAVDGTTGWGFVRTGATDRVRTVHHFDLLIGILGQVAMNAREVVREGGAISFTSKPLEAQQRMASEPQRRFLEWGGKFSSHRGPLMGGAIKT
ncbi:MAG: hypothetical protein V3S25_05165 [Nitrospirales bacterium]